MKTMTITYHASNNNGSFLQAYALQQTLMNQLEVDNQIIDFRGKELLDNYKLFRTFNSPKNLFKNAYTVLHLHDLKVREARFETLRERYLSMTERVQDVNELEAFKTQCDLFIAGSDQIWNTTAPDFNIAFFLPGIKNKIAYGISLGSYSDKTSLSGYVPYINEFSALSTREVQGKERLEEMRNGSVDLVVDPTLLLSRDDYSVLEQETSIPRGKYIFYYSMKYTKFSLEQVAKQSKQLGIPVVTVFTNYHTCCCIPYGMKIQYDAGPAEFLSLISNAELVASDSFHGIVFSVIYHKKFVYVGDTMKSDDRIDCLLRQLGLYAYATVPRSFHLQDDNLVDWNLVDEKLQELKLHSLNYLENIRMNIN